MAVFENATNGYREEVTGLSVLWALLFGWIYYAVKGLWAHLGIQLILAIGYLAALGPPGTLFVVATWLVYAVLTPAILKARYRKAGWVELTDDQAVRHVNRPEPPAPAGVADELLKLVELKKAGALTDAEFDAQKTKLLAGGKAT